MYFKNVYSICVCVTIVNYCSKSPDRLSSNKCATELRRRKKKEHTHMSGGKVLYERMTEKKKKLIKISIKSVRLLLCALPFSRVRRLSRRSDRRRDRHAECVFSYTHAEGIILYLYIIHYTYRTMIRRNITGNNPLKARPD